MPPNAPIESINDHLGKSPMEMITGINFYKEKTVATTSPFPKLPQPQANVSSATSPLKMYQNYLISNHMGGLKANPHGNNNINQLMSINPIFTKKPNDNLRVSVESHGATKITESLEHAFHANQSFHLPQRSQGISTEYNEYMDN